MAKIKKNQKRSENFGGSLGEIMSAQISLDNIYKSFKDKIFNNISFTFK